jgi:hypothetical protein
MYKVAKLFLKAGELEKLCLRAGKLDKLSLKDGELRLPDFQFLIQSKD